MIIERIMIESFGNLSNVSYEFGPGLNVLVGVNESGKSMIAAFIRYMLYGFGTNNTADLTEREKRVSWKSRRAEGQMEIRLSDGRRYRIERTTVATDQAGRIGYREESRFIDLADGTQIRSLPGETFFAVPEQVYANTAFFDQMTGARFSESEMTQAMENLLFSGDERVSTQRAIKTIGEARHSLVHPGGMGGAVNELRAKGDALRARLSQAVRRSAQIHNTEADLHKMSQRIAEAETARDNLAEVDASYRGYLTITSFDKLHEIESRYAELTAEREKLHRENGNDGFLPDEEYLASLQSAEKVCENARQNYLRTVEKLRSVRENVKVTKEAEDLLAKTEAAGGAAALEAEYGVLHKKERTYRGVAWTLTVLAALILGGGCFALRPLSLRPATALVALVVLGVAICAGLFFSNRRRLLRRIAALCADFDAATGADLLCKLRSVEHTKRQKDERTKSISLAEENVQIAHQSFEGCVEELSLLSGKWNKYAVSGSPEEVIESISVHAREFIRKERELSERIAEVRGRMLSLREELAGYSEIAIRAEVSPSRREAMKKINYRTIQEGLVYYSNNCENLHAQYKSLLEELEEYRRDAENPALLRIELAAMDERMATLRRRYRAYELAQEAIASASDRLRAEISPRLSEYAGALMNEATDGRYGSLDITNRLAISYREGDSMHALGSMSGATQQIAYIALRLALIDMLYEENPPLCFDESLAHQDDERVGSMITLLNKIAGMGMQSILLTCHERIARIAAATAESTVCHRLGEENGQ
ncbi:MAG: AAA family ATPase [Clostridia bacterium]|nr:AAA family ATPase [Clostridia bacterium]